jgi:hypothetical protein
MDAALERKLREMVDRQEIWQVLQRWARGMDRLDRELVRSCYFEDATEDHGIYVGNVDGFIEYWADQVARGFKICHHGLMNHHCELYADQAYCETYFSFTGMAAQPPHLLSTGRYIDNFQRRHGEWRIATRIIVIEGRFDLFDTQRYGTDALSAYGEGNPPISSADRNDVSYQRPLRPRRARPL